MRHKKEKIVPPVKLNFGPRPGCGPDFQPIEQSVVMKFPWSFKSDSVDEVYCAHVFNHFPAKQRGQFMDELYRVLKPGAKATIIVPYYSSMRAYADYSYEWPPLCEMSFLMFDKPWRTANQSHPELKCDFEFSYGYNCDPETSVRTPDVQANWIKHQLNTALDLHMNLTKRK